MEKKRRIVNSLIVLLGAGLISIYLLYNSSVDARISSANEISSGSYRIPGKIIISFHQEANEKDYFRMEKGVLSTRLNSTQRLRLNQYGITKARKFLHRGNKAIYKLYFDPSKNETEILNYLKTLSSVEYVQYDYRGLPLIL